MNRIILVLVLVIYRPGLILAFLYSPLPFLSPFKFFNPPPLGDNPPLLPRLV